MPHLRRLRSARATALALLLAAAASGFAIAQDPPAAPRSQGSDPSQDAVRMGSPPALPPDATRESMWPAPTAEDWKKPCLITWQRTFDDALRVARATHKPIMACVNMDGEIASEHFAGVRYRQAETARLFDPYVCVIASVYRHTPRDYDEEGRRIPCPRFGTVTCGEHIAMETVLFDKYFEGRRVAPRHILLEESGAKTYDVYFSWDTQTVFTTLVEGAKNRPPPTLILHDDLPITARAASPDSLDRAAVESAYLQGTHETRRQLIESAMAHPEIDSSDLLRLAIFGFDVEQARLARAALTHADSEASVDLIAEALKVAMDPSERAALLATVDRLAQKYPRARTLSAVHQGLAKTSQWIDVQSWSVPAADESSSKRAYETAASLESRADLADAKPKDAAAHLAAAESFLARAQDPTLERRFVAPMLEDARNNARTAEELGATSWRVHAVLAVTLSALKDRDGALAHAVGAIEAGMPRPGAASDAANDRTAVTVLELFAQARQRAIAKAYRERAPWPPEWLADIHAAYSVLAQHPLGTDQDVTSYYDFLRWLGATPRATQVLTEGLKRFPDSRGLHDRLRAKILWEKGADELEAAYTEMLASPDASPRLEWFAGYAALVAAEHQRRSNATDKALAAYARGIAHFEKDIARFPDYRANDDHFVALALAGRARIDLERDELADATNDILAAFARRPDAAATPDGLNISPVDTAKMLRAKLSVPGLEALAARLQAGLDALDPRLLQLPEYEREIPTPVKPDSRPR